jgi:hypothetical protein
LKLAILITEKDSEASLVNIINDAMHVNDAKIFVVDDGSRIPISIECNSKLTVFRHDKNIGYGAEMNFLLDCIKDDDFDYVMFAEADDRIDYVNLNEVLQKVSNLPCYYDMIKCSYYKRQTPESEFCIPESELAFYEDGLLKNKDIPMMLDHHNAIWSILYSSAFIENHSFVEAKGAGWVDIPFAYDTLLDADAIYRIATPIYKYTLHNVTNSSDVFDASTPFARLLDVQKILFDEGIDNVPVEVLWCYIHQILKMIDLCFYNKRKLSEYQTSRFAIYQCMNFIYSIVNDRSFANILRVFKNDRSLLDDVSSEQIAILDDFNKNGNIDKWISSL